MQLLDNPAWAALTGPQAPFAERYARGARFPADVSPFTAVADPLDPAAWHDLGKLAGPGAPVLIAAPAMTPPPGWSPTLTMPGVQMVGADMPAEADAEAVVLTAADVPEILDLVERTKPGPFRKRTIELGTYLGIRSDGVLAAMAGERLRLPGHTEISAVCTDPAFRGRGLASRLIRAVAAGIQARGDVPILHTTAQNTAAIRLYEQLGFVTRTHIEFCGFEVPEDQA